MRADQSLRRKGGIVVLRQVVTGVYDPDLGAAPTITTDYEGTGVKINYEALALRSTTRSAICTRTQLLLTFFAASCEF